MEEETPTDQQDFENPDPRPTSPALREEVMTDDQRLLMEQFQPESSSRKHRSRTRSRSPRVRHRNSVAGSDEDDEPEELEEQSRNRDQSRERDRSPDRRGDQSPEREGSWFERDGQVPYYGLWNAPHELREFQDFKELPEAAGQWKRKALQLPDGKENIWSEYGDWPRSLPLVSSKLQEVTKDAHHLISSLELVIPHTTHKCKLSNKYTDAENPQSYDRRTNDGQLVVSKVLPKIFAMIQTMTTAVKFANASLQRALDKGWMDAERSRNGIIKSTISLNNGIAHLGLITMQYCHEQSAQLVRAAARLKAVKGVFDMAPGHDPNDDHAELWTEIEETRAKEKKERKKPPPVSTGRLYPPRGPLPPRFQSGGGRGRPNFPHRKPFPGPPRFSGPPRGRGRGRRRN